MPLVAANRIGREVGRTCEITFYGSSFIADNTGAKVAEAGRDGEAVLVASFDRERAPHAASRLGAVPRSSTRAVRPDRDARRSRDRSAEALRDPSAGRMGAARAAPPCAGRFAPTCGATCSPTPRSLTPRWRTRSPDSSRSRCWRRRERPSGQRRCAGPASTWSSCAIDDSWFRDSGPIYVVDDAGRRVATDWTVQLVGRQVPAVRRRCRVRRHVRRTVGHPVRSIDMVFEGGSITGDGDGTLVTTTQCLMHPNRNPTMTQVEIEADPASRARRASG